MPEYRIKVAPDTVAYADGENHKLVVEFAIPGAPTDTIDVKILEDSIHLTAPARDIEYVAALALGWPVKPDKAEATYDHGLLRIEVPIQRSDGRCCEGRHQSRWRGNQDQNNRNGRGFAGACGAAVASHRLATAQIAMSHAGARSMGTNPPQVSGVPGLRDSLC